MKRKKTRTYKSRKTSRTTKKKLVGFTKTKGKYSLVFKKGTKLSLGKGKYSSKATLLTKARTLLKK